MGAGARGRNTGAERDRIRLFVLHSLTVETVQAQANVERGNVERGNVGRCERGNGQTWAQKRANVGAGARGRNTGAGARRIRLFVLHSLTAAPTLTPRLRRGTGIGNVKTRERANVGTCECGTCERGNGERGNVQRANVGTWERGTWERGKVQTWAQARGAGTQAPERAHSFIRSPFVDSRDGTGTCERANVERANAGTGERRNVRMWNVERGNVERGNVGRCERGNGQTGKQT